MIGLEEQIEFDGLKTLKKKKKKLRTDLEGSSQIWKSRGSR
jgi:hypothetical protein